MRLLHDAMRIAEEKIALELQDEAFIAFPLQCLTALIRAVDAARERGGGECVLDDRHLRVADLEEDYSRQRPDSEAFEIADQRGRRDDQQDHVPVGARQGGPSLHEPVPKEAAAHEEDHPGQHRPREQFEKVGAEQGRGEPDGHQQEHGRPIGGVEVAQEKRRRDAVIAGQPAQHAAAYVADADRTQLAVHVGFPGQRELERAGIEQQADGGDQHHGGKRERVFEPQVEGNPGNARIVE